MSVLKDRIECKEEFSMYYSQVILARMTYEKALAAKCTAASDHTCKIPGFCEVCGEETEFLLDFQYSDNIIPNFRERMICTQCKLNSRQRYMISAVMKEYSTGQKIYLYEQVTPLFKRLKALCGTDYITGSEYVFAGIKSGTLVDGIRHEDAENLSFENDSFNFVVSCDVFEHVNNYKKCFSEAARILRQKGKLFLSVPFHADQEKNFRRAEILDEKLIHYTEPIYHGNPMSNDGSLVFWDYGWEMLSDLKDAGFNDAYMRPYYSKECGYLGDIPFIFIATK